jgi:hypothetical protein
LEPNVRHAVVITNGMREQRAAGDLHGSIGATLPIAPEVWDESHSRPDPVSESSESRSHPASLYHEVAPAVRAETSGASCTGRS